MFATIVSKTEILSYGKSLILAYSSFIVLSYWLNPRPSVGLPRYLFGVTGLLSFLFLAGWLLPLELSKRLPMSFAVGIPIFLISTSIYFTPTLWLNPLQKKPKLWMWVLGWLVLSILLGWVSKGQVVPYGGLH